MSYERDDFWLDANLVKSSTECLIVAVKWHRGQTQTMLFQWTKKKKKKQHSQETTQLSKSRPAPYLSPVSPYRLEQLILSPLFLLPLAWKKGPEPPNTIIIKKLIIKEKKTHLKGAISY